MSKRFALVLLALMMLGCQSNEAEQVKESQPKTSGSSEAPGGSGSAHGSPDDPAKAGAQDPAAVDASTKAVNDPTMGADAPKSFEIKFPEAACGAPADCRAGCERCTAEACSPEDAAACKQVGDLSIRTPKLDLEAAAAAYSKGCENGNAVSCSTLALQVQDGRGVPRDHARSRTLYQKSCDGGAGIGCFNLGLMHKYGNGVVRDDAKADVFFASAIKHYETACVAGEHTWCMNLGVVYENGFGVPRDAVKAAKLYKDSCDADFGDACVNLGLQATEGSGVAQNLEVGVQLLEHACYDLGSSLGCGVLGQMLVVGMHGISKDPARGLPLMEGSCLSGGAQACSALSALLAIGEDLPPDLDGSHRYGVRACSLGDSRACFTLGIASLPDENNQGGNMEEAGKWFQRACNIGDGDGCLRLGAMLLMGKGIAKDEVRAVEVFGDACQLRAVEGCLELVSRDIDLPIPEDEATQFYTVACQRGLQKACERVPPTPPPTALQP